jgi:hypothetical protein
VLEDNATKPTGKSFRMAQPRQLPIGFQKCLLCNVFRQMKITQIGIGLPVSHILKSAHDFPECFQVAGTGFDDQQF